MKKPITLLIALIAFIGCAKAQTSGENINVTHYEIHLSNFNFTEHTLQGETYVTLNATTSTNTIVLELKQLTVTAVLTETTGFGINGFSQENDLLTINLSETLDAGQTLTLDILYGGNTFNEQWGGIMWTGSSTANGYVCNMGVGFESIPHNLGKCWFPCVDNFIDKATYDVYVTVPTDLTAVCGGNLESTIDNGDGTKTVHYNVPQEISTYHISFVAGDYVEWTDTYNGIERDIPITVYVKPSQIDKVPGTFVHVKDIAAFYETHFGPYPFNRIGYAITSVGCMEHIDNIGITSGVLTGNTTQEEYVAHELSHMYFGNKVTCSTAGDMWLNEGLAQFCGLFYRVGVYGEDDFQQAMSIKTTSITNWCKSENHWIPLNNMPLDMTYDSDAVYNRGAVIINTMMNYMGRENFLNGIRYYLNTHSYGAATSEQFRDALTEATGIDMNGFFDTYVFQGGMPHYAVNLVEVVPNGTLFDAQVQMSYQHIGSSHVGQNNRVAITFVDANGQLHPEMAHWDGQEGGQTFTLDFEPIAVFADYHNQFLDAKIEKNTMATATGTFNLNTYCDFVINSISDSTLLRIENHLVGPEDPKIPGTTLSTRRYWNFFRYDFGEADIDGHFAFTQSSSQDNDIIQSENDSAVLLYRANVMDPWHTIPYTQEGTWKRGRFTVSNVQTGEYVIAVIDKSQIGLNEAPSPSLHVYPNPSTGMITVELPAESPTQSYRITNLMGQSLMTGTTQGLIDASSLPADTYLITINGKTQKIVIQ